MEGKSKAISMTRRSLLQAISKAAGSTAVLRTMSVMGIAAAPTVVVAVVHQSRHHYLPHRQYRTTRGRQVILVVDRLCLVRLDVGLMTSVQASPW